MLFGGRCSFSSNAPFSEKRNFLGEAFSAVEKLDNVQVGQKCCYDEGDMAEMLRGGRVEGRTWRKC